MNKKFKASLLVVLALLTIVCALPVSAASNTYTYSIDGNQLESPDAYTVVASYDSSFMGLATPISNPTDLITGPDGCVYIADPANNRIVALDRYFKFKFELTAFVNEQGLSDALSGCKGCYVNEEFIYVADTNNSRLVVFDVNGGFVRTIKQPESDIFESDAVYMPIAVAVDQKARIYVVSSSTNEGIIALDNDGEFQGFIGAQKVTYNPLEIIWRSFQTAEQRAKSTSLVSTEFNNITIDKDGFVYVTTSSIDEGSQQAAISNKSGTYAPVKKLNSAGDDIMSRNGFFGPGGEVKVNYSNLNSNISGASRIVDVALGSEGTWSIIDNKRSKVFTYDQYGNLLFVFGDVGMMLGNVQNLTAITYQDDDILLLDSQLNNVTKFSRTDYGDVLINALANENNQNYDAAIDDYRTILQRNSNFDTAYVGIGKALYREYDWTGAMKYFKIAYDTSNYSNAYKMYRKDIISVNLIWIALGLVVIIFLLAKFFGFIKKVNDRVALSGKKRTFWEEVVYAFHLILHPFDGFWDLKHEKRGSVRAGIFWIAVSVLAFTYQALGRGYLFNPRQNYSSVFVQLIGLVVPILLWVTSNWCLTTLFDGEGSFKDVFIATAYCTTPLVLFIVPSVILSNFVTVSEMGLVNGLVTIAWYWVGILVFFGMMVTHDYSIGKNILTCIGTIVGMGLIMFLAGLFSALLVKMVNFVSNIVIEISYRV